MPAIVAGTGAWAAVADDKEGWTVIAASVFAVVGAFGPTVADWISATTERQRKLNATIGNIASAELPPSVLWLLNPYKTVVPFIGRGWSLRQLENWIHDPQASAVRLVTGPGGTGKTRLAHELASRMTNWQTHWTSPHAEAETAELLHTQVLPQQTLLIVDYAETRDRAELAALLSAAQQARTVRVLLLARSPGLWWETLSAAYPRQAALIDTLTVAEHTIELQAEIEDHLPHQIIAEAITAFATRLDRPEPAKDPTRQWEPGTPILRLHAEALLAVLVGRHQTGRYDVLAEVLSHEARYWHGVARRAGLLTDNDDPTAETELRQAVGIAALLGASDKSQIADLIKRTPLLADVGQLRERRYVGWLASLYPGAEGTSALGTVQPDLLAETLATHALNDCSVNQREAVFKDLTLPQAVQALTVLGRASAHQDNANGIIDIALGADAPRMTEAVVHVAAQFPGLFTNRLLAQLPDAEFDHSEAMRIAESIPYPSLELGRVALALTEKILANVNEYTHVEEAARWTTIYAVRLSEAGRPRGGQKAIQAATQLYRDLAAKHGNAYLPPLAMSLNNSATHFAANGMRTEALKASQESVETYRALVHASPDEHQAHMAMALSTHAAQLMRAGRTSEAVIASQEALDLRRSLTDKDRGNHLPELAASLQNHAIYLAAEGKRTDALSTSQEALELLRELAAADADGHLHNLAAAISNHAGRLADAGRREEALAASVESVDLYRILVTRHPRAHLHDLAFALSNLVLDLADAGQAEQALAAAEEATHLYQLLSASNPDAYRPELAGSLNNLANQLGNAGMWVNAAEASREGVALRRQLVASNRNAFLPDLALALHTHSLSLHKANRPADALEASHEAVAMRRELTGLNPDVHLPELAKTLNNHALRLAETGRAVAAFEASRESVAIRRDLVARHGNVYLPALAASLWHSGLVALTTGKISNESVAQTAEGVHYLTTLAITEPAAFGGRQQAAANVLARLRRRTST